MSIFKKLTVVCTGNICRSPIAEVLLRERLRDKGVECVSAGTHALVGYPADGLSLAVMADHGYDASAHRAQQATLPLLTWSDLILVLDRSHFDWITQKAPQLRGRVHKLGKWNGNMDIDDPYGLPKEAFERAYDEIDRAVRDWVIKLG